MSMNSKDFNAHFLSIDALCRWTFLNKQRIPQVTKYIQELVYGSKATLLDS